MSNLIAVCGVDGCGKSSLINEYAKRTNNKDLVTVHKKNSKCVELTSKFHDRSDDPKADWLQGSFALSIGAGAMFDFLEHYTDKIIPLLDKFGNILSDRYTFCFLAYLDAVNEDKKFDRLFHFVKPANHIIHIDVDFDLLDERYKKREEKNEDEFIELMVAFRNGYKKVYDRLELSPIYIKNNGKFEDTFTEFSSCVDRLILT